jgi:hypothetical protein
LPEDGAAIRPNASLTDLKPGVPFERRVMMQTHFAISGNPSKPESIVAVNPAAHKVASHHGMLKPSNSCRLVMEPVLMILAKVLKGQPINLCKTIP